MIRSWLLTAWRSAIAGSLYSLLNLIGLATGAAVTLLIGLWVHDELAFNKMHDNYERLAQVLDNQPADGGIATSDLLPIPLAAELRNKYSEDFKHIALYWPEFRHILTVGHRSIAHSGSWVQPDLPVMLTLPMVEGSREALQDRSNVLISQSLATALFGSSDPINRTIRVDNSIEVKVGGVFSDLPANSSFHEAGIFLSLDKAVDEMAWLKDYPSAWDARGWKLYVELNEHADLDRLNHNIAGLLSAHGGTEKIFLYPMRKWRLYDKFSNGVPIGGRVSIVKLFAGIGVFVLLLACINFMNLATARSQRRAREVGIRKVIGSLRYQLVGQFLAEAFLFTTLSVILALGIAQLSLPFFNRLAGKQLAMPWYSPLFAVSVVGFIVITTVLSGSYPAFYLSHFQPVKVLKGDLTTGTWSAVPRKLLVITQFTVSISLVIGAIFIAQQISYARDRPIGYSRAGLLNIGKNTSNLYQAQYNSLRDDLLRTGMVSDMAQSSDVITASAESSHGISWLGEDTTTKPSFSSIAVTSDFGNTIHWQMIAGRNFQRDFATDSDKVIINETASRLMAFPQPIGREIRINGKGFTIIGVVRDMVLASPFQNIQPGLFTLAPAVNLNDILIRVMPSAPMDKALAAIRQIFHHYNPASPFDYHFVDTDYAQKFADEQRVDALARAFTVLAIFISCLGLLGLSAFTAGRRAREIGIRKILGSSVFSSWRLPIGETVWLVFLSAAIALPLAGLFMHHWLLQYEYRVPLSWWVFAAAAAGALTLALLTVSFHALKAAYTNPARILRTQ